MKTKLFSNYLAKQLSFHEIKEIEEAAELEAKDFLVDKITPAVKPREFE
jgi:hypothetical protein